MSNDLLLKLQKARSSLVAIRRYAESKTFGGWRHDVAKLCDDGLAATSPSSPSRAHVREGDTQDGDTRADTSARYGACYGSDDILDHDWLPETAVGRGTVIGHRCVKCPARIILGVQ